MCNALPTFMNVYVYIMAFVKSIMALAIMVVPLWTYLQTLSDPFTAASKLHSLLPTPQKYHSGLLICPIQNLSPLNLTDSSSAVFYLVFEVRELLHFKFTVTAIISGVLLATKHLRMADAAALFRASSSALSHILSMLLNSSSLSLSSSLFFLLFFFFFFFTSFFFSFSFGCFFLRFFDRFNHGSVWNIQKAKLLADRTQQNYRKWNNSLPKVTL